MPACPECGGQKLCKAGFDARRNQLLLCKNCLRRFQVKLNVGSQVVESSNSIDQFRNGVVSFAGEKSLDQSFFEGGEDVGSHKLPIVAKNLNALPSYNRERRAAEMQLQASNETNTQNRTVQILKGEMVSFMWHLSKLELNEKTIYCRARNLELLFRNGADLRNPESVKAVLATHKEWSNGYKKNMLYAYKSFAKWKKIDLSEVELPKYQNRLQIALCS